MLFCSLTKGLTTKLRMLCFVIINSVLLNVLRVWIFRISRLRPLSAKNPKLWKVLSFKRGMGSDIASPALPTAKDYVVLVSAISRSKHTTLKRTLTLIIQCKICVNVLRTHPFVTLIIQCKICVNVLRTHPFQSIRKLIWLFLGVE